MIFFQSFLIFRVVCIIGNNQKNYIFRVFPIFKIPSISSPPLDWPLVDPASCNNCHPPYEAPRRKKEDLRVSSCVGLCCVHSHKPSYGLVLPH